MAKEIDLKVGMTVKLSETSVFYTDCPSKTNPRNINGIVEVIENPYKEGNMDITVRWDNGEVNVYDDWDLDIVETIKVGDRVKIISNDTGGILNFFPLGTIAKVIRVPSGDDSKYVLEGPNSDDFLIKQVALKSAFELTQPIKIETMKQVFMSITELMEFLVKETADTLLKANNTVTTLEIKVDLIKNFPEIVWKQSFVSRVMDQLNSIGVFTYTDNGTFRTYSDPRIVVAPLVPTVSSKADKLIDDIMKAATTRISKTKALELVKNNKGHFFTSVFTKKDGTTRVINGQYIKDTANEVLGYIKVREAGKLKMAKNGKLDPKDTTIRNVNIQTLKAIKIAGNSYKVS